MNDNSQPSPNEPAPPAPPKLANEDIPEGSLMIIITITIKLRDLTIHDGYDLHVINAAAKEAHLNASIQTVKSILNDFKHRTMLEYIAFVDGKLGSKKEEKREDR